MSLSENLLVFKSEETLMVVLAVVDVLLFSILNSYAYKKGKFRVYV